MMQLSFITDALGHLPFEEMLDTQDCGIEKIALENHHINLVYNWKLCRATSTPTESRRKRSLHKSESRRPCKPLRRVFKVADDRKCMAVATRTAFTISLAIES
jgi:hypothetical protein